MLAAIKSKLPAVLATLFVTCIVVGCVSNSATQPNINVSRENADTLSRDVLNLVKAILNSVEFSKRQYTLNQNDPFLKKLGALQKPKRFEAIEIVSDDTYLVSSSEEDNADSWKLENVELIAKQIYGKPTHTYSLLSKQLMNVETHTGIRYQLYITKAMTYGTDNEFTNPDQGAFVIGANDSNLYVVIRNGELDIKLDEHGTGTF